MEIIYKDKENKINFVLEDGTDCMTEMESLENLKEKIISIPYEIISSFAKTKKYNAEILSLISLCKDFTYETDDFKLDLTMNGQNTFYFKGKKSLEFGNYYFETEDLVERGFLRKGEREFLLEIGKFLPQIVPSVRVVDRNYIPKIYEKDEYVVFENDYGKEKDSDYIFGIALSEHICAEGAINNSINVIMIDDIAIKDLPKPNRKWGIFAGLYAKCGNFILEFQDRIKISLENSEIVFNHNNDLETEIASKNISVEKLLEIEEKLEKILVYISDDTLESFCEVLKNETLAEKRRKKISENIKIFKTANL